MQAVSNLTTHPVLSTDKQMLSPNAFQGQSLWHLPTNCEKPYTVLNCIVLQQFNPQVNIEISQFSKHLQIFTRVAKAVAYEKTFSKISTLPIYGCDPILLRKQNSPDTKTKPLSLLNCLTNLPQWKVPGKRRGKPHAEVSQHCENQQKQERRGSPCPLPSAPCNQSCLPADASNPLRFPHHCPPPAPPPHLHCYVAAPPPCRIPPRDIYTSRRRERGRERWSGNKEASKTSEGAVGKLQAPNPNFWSRQALW